MGLLATFQAAAVTAQAAFGDVFVPVRYSVHASTTYNASSGVASATASSVSVNISKDAADATWIFQLRKR